MASTTREAWAGAREHIRLVVSRAPVSFSEQEVAAVRARFDRRAAASRWRAVGAVGRAMTERLVFYAAAPEDRYFALARYDDGIFELACVAGPVIERAASLERLLASFERRCALN